MQNGDSSKAVGRERKKPEATALSLMEVKEDARVTIKAYASSRKKEIWSIRVT
jgi:hypothetical protein